MSTFTDALAALSPDELRDLVRTRPDAFFPTPPSSGALATRLALPGSVALGLRTLTAADLLALERLASAGAELGPVDAGTVSGEALTRLRERAFVYGPDTAVRIAPGTLTGLPAGWRISDQAPTKLEERMAQLDGRQRRVLETLAASGGTGTTRAAAPDADPDTPVAKLIAVGLLVRVDAATVRLPRPVREVLAGHAPRVYPVAEPPAHDVDQTAVDQEAAGQGLEFVRRTRQLITELLRSPVPLNKDGTVGVRALAALEKTLGFDPSLVITVGESAGLVGRGDVDDADVLAATHDGLGWLDAPLHEQWAVVLAGWVASPWRTDSEHRLLSTEMHAPDVRHARRTILEAEGDTQRLLFQAPIAASGMRDTLIAAVVSEARATGALAGGSPGAAQGLSSPLLALLAGGAAAAAARELVPAEVDQVIAQADMTILAPGPLVPESARFLERFAELDSPGLASVWRVTDASVRSALAGGVTSAEIHEWLRVHTIGEVPQGMAFLIDDVARTHGSIRAGTALSYIRSEDPALIAAAAERTGVRVLAPTVAVSDLPLPRLIASLRDAHLQPTAEDERGVELSVAPEPDLVPATPSTMPRPKAVPPAQVERIIEAMRTSSASPGAEDAGGAGGALGESALETLRAAARGRRHVKLGYVDKNGRGATLTALPLSVSAGQVDVLDEATDRVVRIALPRITRVVLA